MDFGLIADNLLNPPILFFLLGCLAAFSRSDLTIPQQLSKSLALYLLLSIGMHGGYELSKSGITADIALALGAAMLMAIVVPIYSFWILRIRFDLYNAAALAAAYGSISAVTFITGVSFLNQLDVAFGGHMVAAMALMESPAIIIGVLLVRMGAGKDSDEPLDWSELLREAFLNGSVFLLVGSLVIGFITGEPGWKAMEPLTGDLFKGVLAFFLLDMGLVAARHMGDLKKAGLFLVGFAIGMALLNAAIGIGLARLLGFGAGDALLFTLLTASASYIAVPAAMRLSVPEANPSFYIAASLAVTFPFNIIVGIPLYYQVIDFFWR
ncbi:sodium-dependent bicarbonate transport family permease [Persicimonas caeni]|uniref:Sodium-dependent bicarbonate transport family permease n=1 Tax=Persicimonas caeni TaxID=2292766 RepID=A0A4Y6PRG8_PERCE|nr:sodium-dependent bicarbonate transport family permease [Persicimonas caeni]QDG50617.1 sodium-dependent bicarbonate transport family permease [Persicimonas caeni]QED31838.1 sodium-dependent bicarbonate transport family permease [Persicimonas caeni]